MDDNMEVSESLEGNLLEIKIQLMKSLSDPLLDHKTEAVHQLRQIDVDLFSHDQLAYRCRKCNYIHQKGQIYLEHKEYAEIITKFPEIVVPSFKVTTKVRITQIRKNKSESLFRTLPKYHKLTIHPGSEDDASYIEVFTENLAGIIVKMGILDPSQKKTLQIQEALAQNFRIKAFYLGLEPRIIRVYKRERWNRRMQKQITSFQEFWDQEYARASVEITNLNKFMQIFKGLVEYFHLGHTEVYDAFYRLGPEIIPFLQEMMGDYPNLASLLEKLYDDFKIRIKSDFSIIR